MKKVAMVALIAVLVVGVSFAQGMMGRGNGPIDWKAGTSVFSEYKKMSGTLVLGQKLDPIFKADGVEYTLMLGRNAGALLDVKNGDTLVFEGVVTTVKIADQKISPVLHPFKAIVNGKEIVLDDGSGPDFGMRGGQGRGAGMGRHGHCR